MIILRALLNISDRLIIGTIVIQSNDSQDRLKYIKLLVFLFIINLCISLDQIFWKTKLVNFEVVK